MLRLRLRSVSDQCAQASCSPGLPGFHNKPAHSPLFSSTSSFWFLTRLATNVNRCITTTFCSGVWNIIYILLLLFVSIIPYLFYHYLIFLAFVFPLLQPIIKLLVSFSLFNTVKLLWHKLHCKKCYINNGDLTFLFILHTYGIVS